MRPLEALIRAEIAASGPMRLDQYMGLCLTHPEHGYYPTRDPFGAAGDFVTAPEVSQMFGELVGLWLAQCWLDQGSPEAFVLAELGPGRGTLMADVLRAAGRVPGFAPTEIRLEEASPIMRRACQAALPGHPVFFGVSARGHDVKPLFLLANEFFDALPVRQFQKVDTIWLERCVGLRDGALAIVLQPLRDGPHDACNPALPDGAIVEVRPEATRLVAPLAAQIAAHGGAALIVDYGAWQGGGDTLQALRNHAPVSPFDAPGTADLTTHVAFEALASHAGLRAGFTSQGAFLDALGIGARAARLAERNPDQADAIAIAQRRLTHADEMGQLFKVLALTPETAPPPPGFAP